jgi:hypothetical protein
MTQIVDVNAIAEVFGALKQIINRGIDETGVVQTQSIDATGASRFKDGLMTPLGYAKFSSPSSSTLLSASPAVGVALPADAKYVLLQAETQNIRWRDDGSAPTASEGMLLTAGDPGFWYNGNLAAFRFIQAAAGGVLRASYYK